MGVTLNSSIDDRYQSSDVYSETILEKESIDTEEVLKIQRNLEILGYSTEEESGYFGANTRSALKAFQKDFGLQTTGIADAQTITKINQAITSNTQVSASDTFIKAPDLVFGNQGQAVGDLQQSLKRLGFYSESTDYYFGFSTEEAVKKFQAANNLQDTGIVDTDTKLAISRRLSNLSNNYSLSGSYRDLYIASKGIDVSGSNGILRNTSSLIDTEGIIINNSSSGISDIGSADSFNQDEVNQWKSAWDSNYSNIEKGNSNNAVKYMQYILTKLGYLNDVVDGIFGKNTLDAVQRFQSSHLLNPDGIVGPKTKQTLNKVFYDNFGTSTATPPVSPTRPVADLSAEAVKWAVAWDSAGTLRVGSTGDAVKFLQYILNTHNHDCGDIDGVFGEKTFEAVKSYQRTHLLQIDGIVGSETRKNINIVYDNRNTTTMPMPGSITAEQETKWKRAWEASGDLTIDSSGDAVRYLQYVLSKVHHFSDVIDGEFGPITFEAVKSFQRSHILKEDGIVGSQTKASINKVYADSKIPAITGPVIPASQLESDKEKLKNRLQKIVNNATKQNVLDANSSYETTVTVFLRWFQDSYHKNHYLEATYNALDSNYRMMSLNHWAFMVENNYNELDFTLNLMPREYMDTIPDTKTDDSSLAGNEITSENKYDSIVARQFYEKYYYPIDAFHNLNYMNQTSTTATNPSINNDPSTGTVTTEVPTVMTGLQSARTGIISGGITPPTTGIAAPSPRISTPTVMPKNYSSDIDVESSAISAEAINPGRAVLEAYRNTLQPKAISSVTNGVEFSDGAKEASFKTWARIMYGSSEAERKEEFAMGLVMGAIFSGIPLTGHPLGDLIVTVHDFIKDGGVQKTADFGKFLYKSISNLTILQDVRSMFNDAYKACTTAYGQAEPAEKGRMIGSLIGQTLLILTGVNSSPEGIQSLVKGGGFTRVLSKVAGTVSKLRTAAKTSIQELEGLITNVFSRSKGMLKMEVQGLGTVLVDEAQIVGDASGVVKERFNKFVESKLVKGAAELLQNIMIAIRTNVNDLKNLVRKIIRCDGFREVQTPDGSVFRILDEDVPSTSSRSIDDVAEQLRKQRRTEAGRMDLSGKPHPVSGVLFDAEGFPIFDSHFDTYLSPDNFLKSRDTHFSKASKDLYSRALSDPKFASQFTAEELEMFRVGDKPSRFTWHHHQDSGRMQLVDAAVHKQTGHSGGFTIWGPGN